MSTGSLERQTVLVPQEVGVKDPTLIVPLAMLFQASGFENAGKPRQSTGLMTTARNVVYDYRLTKNPGLDWSDEKALSELLADRQKGPNPLTDQQMFNIIGMWGACYGFTPLVEIHE